MLRRESLSISCKNGYLSNYIVTIKNWFLPKMLKKRIHIAMMKMSMTTLSLRLLQTGEELSSLKMAISLTMIQKTRTEKIIRTMSIQKSVLPTTIQTKMAFLMMKTCTIRSPLVCMTLMMKREQPISTILRSSTS